MTATASHSPLQRTLSWAYGLVILLMVLLVLPAVGRPAEDAASKSEDGKQTLELSAKDTLTVVRMNHGDRLQFRLANGEVRNFELQDSSAQIVEQVRGGIVYRFECRLLADGQPLTLRRFVCSQETFYEPWVVNGVRIWFSSSQSIFKRVPIRYPEDHDDFAVDAVLALQDATLPICPEPIQPWFPIERHFIDVGTCYNGDDPWLGPYLGQACHVGLDINMPKGTPLHAPLTFDDHWIFSADHRWRGVRRWPNGDIWGLQSHHVDRMLVPQRGGLKVGTHYAEAAGKGIGSHQHSHFEFRLGEGVLNRGQVGGIEVDPWILFWQIFENDRTRKGEIRAEIDSLSPNTTGQVVRFSAKRSRGGLKAKDLRYYWAFGDGCWASDATPEHTFVKPGIYPVTLVIDDGQQRATHTQHISVNGEAVTAPALELESNPEDPSFRPRPVFAADVYGWPIKRVPHTLHFAAPPTQGPDNAPPPRLVFLCNQGKGKLPDAGQPRIRYLGERVNWLLVELRRQGSCQVLDVQINARQAGLGRHEAVVEVECPGAINGLQGFRVELFVRPSPTDDVIVVDDRDDGFYAPPSVWVGHQFLRCPDRGYQNRYLTDAGLSDYKSCASFTPDLAAGRYEVWLHEKTPMSESVFDFCVRSKEGSSTNVRFSPKKFKTLKLGTFDFVEGNVGSVEIWATSGEEKTPVVVDALEFHRVRQP